MPYSCFSGLLSALKFKISVRRGSTLERDMKSLALSAASWLFLGVLAVAVAQAQVISPIQDCGPKGCDPTIAPASAPPPSTAVAIDRAKPSNQTGMGRVFPAAIPTGGAATLQGSSSHTYSVPQTKPNSRSPKTRKRRQA
jgi:hypothetical protein